MAYYKRRRALLYDELLELMIETWEKEIEKLPEKKQAIAWRKMSRDPKGLSEVIGKIAKEVAIGSRKQIEEAIREDSKDREDFERSLYKKYKPILDTFAELLGVCLEAVESHREIIHTNLGEKDTVLPMVLRLEARVHRIASEVLTLVRTGYATGALSRWRSMHEITVVMSYVIEYGEKAIKLMQAHEAVSGYKAMKDYQTYHKQLNMLPYSSYDMRLAKGRYDRRIARYGQNFKRDYGWATVLTPSVTDFRSLEKHVGIDHLRPYYKLSSMGVHMEWRSLTTGEEFEALDKHGVVLIGPADYGFEDAISLAMITAAHATTMVLTYNSSMKSLMYVNIIRDIQQRGEAELMKLAKKSEPPVV